MDILGRGSRFLLRIGKWVLLFVLLVVVAYFILKLKLDVFRINAGVQNMKPIFIAMHLMAAFLLWWYWQRIVDWGIGKGYVKKFEIDRVRKLRLKVPLYLVLYTALVVAGPTYIYNVAKALLA